MMRLSEEMPMKRNASAHWEGGLKDGKGTISTESGVLANTQYSFGTRFESGKGTNPEELIGAAHAGCFSMALSLILTQAGNPPESIETEATVHLVVKAKVPGADAPQFQTAANNAKAGCPVSKVLNATITMEASLES